MTYISNILTDGSIISVYIQYYHIGLLRISKTKQTVKVHTNIKCKNIICIAKESLFKPFHTMSRVMKYFMNSPEGKIINESFSCYK